MILFTLGFLEKMGSATFYLVSGILWKKLLLEKLNYHVIFYRTISSMFFILLIGLVYNYFGINNYETSSLFAPTIWDWVYMVLVCFFSFWGLYFYTTAIQSGRYSLVTPLSGIAALFSFVTSIIIYNESLTALRFISLILIVGGLIFHQKDKLTHFKLSKEVLLILLCSVFWGISFVLYLIPIQKFGVLNFSFVLEGCVFTSSILLLVLKDKKITPPKFDSGSLFFCVLMGIMVAGGSVLNNLSITEIPISLNITIGLLFEIGVLIIGIYIFKERLNFKDWILIIVSSIASFMLMI